MSKIVALRARAKNEFAEREGVNLTYWPFIAGAAIDALALPTSTPATTRTPARSPGYDTENLGFAVDTEQGLLSPVVHNAGDLSWPVGAGHQRSRNRALRQSQAR